MKTGMRMIVRGKELHCRQGWRDDRWDVAIDDVVLDIRVREPESGSGSGSQRVTMTSMPNGDTPHAVTRTAESVICAWSADTSSRVTAPEVSAER